MKEQEQVEDSGRMLEDAKRRADYVDQLTDLCNNPWIGAGFLKHIQMF